MNKCNCTLTTQCQECKQKYSKSCESVRLENIIIAVQNTNNVLVNKKTTLQGAFKCAL